MVTASVGNVLIRQKPGSRSVLPAVVETLTCFITWDCNGHTTTFKSTAHTGAKAVSGQES